MLRYMGEIEMKKIVRIVFTYDDGTENAILDPRACALFQSRCNSSGIVSGMEDYIVELEKDIKQ
jgi:hypothetical protein